MKQRLGPMTGWLQHNHFDILDINWTPADLNSFILYAHDKALYAYIQIDRPIF